MQECQEQASASTQPAQTESPSQSVSTRERFVESLSNVLRHSELAKTHDLTLLNPNDTVALKWGPNSRADYQDIHIRFSVMATERSDHSAECHITDACNNRHAVEDWAMEWFTTAAGTEKGKETLLKGFDWKVRRVTENTGEQPFGPARTFSFAVPIQLRTEEGDGDYEEELNEMLAAM